MVLQFCNLTTRSSSVLSVHISVLFLFAMFSNKEGFFAQGRTLSMQSEFTKGNRGYEMLMVSSMIGSRPPRCEGICGACSRCEPVPVPAIQETKSAVLAHINTNNGRLSERSNYKPMNWKCKCGNFIFNPWAWVWERQIKLCYYSFFFPFLLFSCS